MQQAIQQAAGALQRADALLIAAGAGMGVDSGLPDFRGDAGFWKAYPPFAALGLSFIDLANPAWFQQDPELAWGFYGHRLQLYRETTPHNGFQILHQWAEQRGLEAFVFTSNVDGQFQRAGFNDDHIVECHGSIHYLQCTDPCCEAIWPAEEVDLDIDETTFRAMPPLPLCPHCGALARPNILMFHDGQWLWNRTQAQQERFREWIEKLSDKELVIIECGAGTAVPSVRNLSEKLARYGATLIRINPQEPQGPEGTIAIQLGALKALLAIQDEVER